VLSRQAALKMVKLFTEKQKSVMMKALKTKAEMKSIMHAGRGPRCRGQKGTVARIEVFRVAGWRLLSSPHFQLSSTDTFTHPLSPFPSGGC
jgi:hypothetical protein